MKFATAFLEFKNNLITKGLEYFGKYYGRYEGFVVDSNDPEGRGRIKVKCPKVWGDDYPDKWVLPMGMYAGNKAGMHFMPDKDDPVWIGFEYGDPNFPYWQYGWWLKNRSIEIADNKVYCIVTPGGHTLYLGEKDNKVYLAYKNGKSIELTEDLVNLGTLGGQHVPAVLGDKNADLHKDIIDLIQDIISAINSSPTTAQDGGATFKAGLISALQPTYLKALQLSSVDADQTKSQVVKLD